MAQLNIASNRLKYVYIGSTRIKKIYVGSSLIFTSDSPRLPTNFLDTTAVDTAMSSVGAGTSVVVNGITHTLKQNGDVQAKLTNNSNSNYYPFSWGGSAASHYYVKKIAADTANYLYVLCTWGNANNARRSVEKISFSSSGTYSLVKSYLVS